MFLNVRHSNLSLKNGLNKCEYIRRMQNNNYLGKVPSKAAEAEKRKNLEIRNFNA